MKKLALLACVIFISGFLAQAQDLEEILGNHFQTIGQDQVLTIQTMINTGKSIQMGMETNFTLYAKRPDKFRLEADIQGQKFIQAFDGQKGWTIMPWAGTTDPMELPADQVKFMKWQADMDGMLYNWKEKGYAVELTGKEDWEGTEVYKIKLTTQDNDVFYYFMDAENFVILKTEMNTKYQGNDLKEETLTSNYKEVEGVIMPFSMESFSNGQLSRQIMVESYTFNSELDDSMFAMPEKKTEEPAPEEQE